MSKKKRSRPHLPTKQSAEPERDNNHSCLNIRGLTQAAKDNITEFIAEHDWQVAVSPPENLGSDIAPLLSALYALQAIDLEAQDGLYRDGLDGEGYRVKAKAVPA